MCYSRQPKADWKQAKHCYRDAAKIFRKTNQAEQRADALVALAECLWYDRPQPHWTRAVILCDGALKLVPSGEQPPGRSIRARAFRRLAECFRFQPEPRWAEAVARYKDALELLTAPEDAAERLWTLYDLAESLRQQPEKDWDGAVTYLEQALKSLPAGQQQAERALILGRLADGLRNRPSSDWARAIECYREAVKVYRALGRRTDLAAALRGLGDVLREQPQGDRLGAAACYQEVVELSDAPEQRKEWAESLCLLAECLIEQHDKEWKELAALHPEPTIQAALRARLGLVAASRAALSEAREHLLASFELWKKAGRGESDERSTAAFDRLLDSLPPSIHINEALRLLASHPALESSLQRSVQLSEVRSSINSFPRLYWPTGQNDSAKYRERVKPIVLEVAASLIDEDDACREIEQRLLTDVAKIRERIKQKFGVIIPGVHARNDTGLQQGTYQLLLHEVRYVTAQVVARHRYCPDGDRCRAMGIDEKMVINAADKTIGMWLPETKWDRVQAEGLPLWDSLDYMFYHLECFISVHLHLLNGFQETQLLCREWAKTGQGNEQDLVGKALPDDAAWIRLVHVITGLLKEQVPVKNLIAILGTLSDGPKNEDVGLLIERIRHIVREELPGNTAAAQLLGLSPTFEATIRQGVQERDGKHFLVLQPTAARQLRKAVRKGIINRNTRQLVLVVRDPGLRPFVRRFLEYEWPTLTVLAASELTDRFSLPTKEIHYTDSSTLVDD